MWRWIAVVTLVCAVATGLFVFRWISRAGASDLENWIGDYLVTIGQEYLKPEISLASIDYRYPRTVVITGLALIADGIPILSVDQAWLELEETPRAGQPLLIRDVRLVRPAVTLKKRAESGLPVGWSDLVRDEVNNRDAPPAGYRVSDFLRMRRVSVENADFTYDAADGSPPMALHGIQFGLDASPDPSAPGVYQLAGSLSQPNLGALSMQGLFDLDAGELRLNQLMLRAAVDESRYAVFPPAAQAWLRDHRFAATLALRAEGLLPLMIRELRQIDVRFDIELTGARFAAGAGLVKCKRLASSGRFSDGVLNVTTRADLLGGSLEGPVTWDLASSEHAEFHASFNDIDLSSLAALLPHALRARLTPYNPRGSLSGTVDAATRQSNTAEWSGKASLTVAAPIVNVHGVEVASEQVEIGADGVVPLNHWQDAEISGRLTSGRLRLTLSNSAVDATSVEIQGDWRQRTAQLRGSALAFNGRIEGTVRVPLGANRIDLEASAHDLQMEQLPAKLISNSPVERLFGRASLNLSGAGVPNDWAASDLELRVRCENARVALRGLHLPAPRANFRIVLRERRLTSQGQLDLLGGSAQVGGALSLASPRELRADWRAEGIRLERIGELRNGAQREPRTRGVLAGGGVVQFDLDNLPNSLGGAGEVRVTQGKLMNLPVLGDLITLVAGHVPLLRTPDTDSGTARFSLLPDRIHLDEFDLTCLFLAIRGNGDAYYDGRLDLTLQTGPLTRVEKLLGPLRELVEQLSDRLVRYHVTGTTTQPAFEVEAFGVKPDLRGLFP